MSSTSGFLGAPFLAPYCMSKFALEAMADALRVELKPWGIRVSVIQPGAIATPIWQKSKAEAEAMADRIPEEGHRLYGDAMAALRAEVARAETSRAIPAEAVARCVVHAFEANRPKTRYRVGRDVNQQYIAARWLPDRLRDWLIARAMGLPKVP